VISCDERWPNANDTKLELFIIPSLCISTNGKAPVGKSWYVDSKEGSLQDDVAKLSHLALVTSADGAIRHCHIFENSEICLRWLSRYNWTHRRVGKSWDVDSKRGSIQGDSAKLSHLTLVMSSRWGYPSLLNFQNFRICLRWLSRYNWTHRRYQVIKLFPRTHRMSFYVTMLASLITSSLRHSHNKVQMPYSKNSKISKFAPLCESLRLDSQTAPNHQTWSMCGSAI
jgi:hypothetical protein